MATMVGNQSGSGPMVLEECYTSYSDAETSVLRVVTLTSAALSLFGALFIICSYFMFLRIRTYPYKLVTLLSLANLGSSVGYYVALGDGPHYGEHLCITSGGCLMSAAMTQFFDVASFFWVAAIAHNIHSILVLERGREVERNQSLYQLVSWGGSGVLTVIVYMSDGFGDAGLWCWIPKNRPFLRFFCYYLPLVSVFVYTITCYIAVSRAVRLRGDTAQGMINTRVRLYVLVFVIVRVWSVVHRLHNYLGLESPFILGLCHGLFSPLQGFANALVYGCNKNIIAAYRGYCFRSSDNAIEMNENTNTNSESMRQEPDIVLSPGSRFSSRSNDLEPISAQSRETGGSSDETQQNVAIS